MGMKKKTNRNGKQEQLATVTRVFTENEIDLKDVGAGLTLYASLNRAKQRAGERKGYEDIEFLLEKKQSKALIQVINDKPSFWNEWKIQQKIYEESGFDENQRASLHRINPKGHYLLDNIGVLPYGDHLKENAVVTGFFGTKDGKSYFEYFHSITAASKFLGIPANKLKGIENLAVNWNGFNGIYGRIEQRPARSKAEGEKLDKASYIGTLKSIDRLEAKTELIESEANLLVALHKTKVVNEMLGFHLL